MVTIDLEAPVRFLTSAFRPDDWIAVLLKSHATGGTAQRVVPCSLVASRRFQAWLRAQSARRFSVFVSVNAIRPQRKARTRDAIGEVRHVFLDVDRDGPAVLAAIEARPDLPVPSYVLHSSPNRVHVMWRVTGFTRETVEALQKQLARDLRTDTVATSCAQMTRLPGFFNHKYRPAPMVNAVCFSSAPPYPVADFPQTDTRIDTRLARVVTPAVSVEVIDRARRYLAAIPPAIQGRHGDVETFRACCRLVRGFALDDDSALALLTEWNQRCEPPWSLTDLRAKLAGARRYGREPMGNLLVSRH